MKHVCIIGGGPAGLMAAETLLKSDIPLSVTIYDAKPSLGRKLLMAGKSGLNLTKDESAETFIETYPEGGPWLAPMLTDFGPQEVQAWAGELGQDVFTGSTKRVFPVAMKASPLLRAWLARLIDAGAVLAPRHRWTGWADGAAQFETSKGSIEVRADAYILALGGSSWARLGSDGAWASVLAEDGAELAPFAASNVGVTVDWSDHMQAHLGTPLKGISLTCGQLVSNGEIVISKRGLEGGGLYALSAAVRSGAPLVIDLKPRMSAQAVTAELAKPAGKDSLANRLRKRLKLNKASIALLNEFARPLPQDPAKFAGIIKALPVHHGGLRPIDEAISTAGGVMQSAVTDDLMLSARPGVFCAGEMLDWDAPTGGYLMTACLATGRRAGLGALRYLRA